MAAVTSLGLVSRETRRTPIKGANTVVHVRLRVNDEDTIRYVFCDWERDAGVRSNQEAQVNALVDRSFQRTVETAERQVRRDAEAGRHRLLAHKRIPLADRGWSTLTARSTKGGASAPVRFDRDFQPERWTHRYEDSPVRSRTLVAFRALARLAETGRGRHVVVLYKLYGPRDPAADYLRFADFAPIAHLTPTAYELSGRATRALRRSIAERHAGGLTNLALEAEGVRLAVLERASAGEYSAEGVTAAAARLEELDRAEGLVGDIEAWTQRRAEVERANVDERQALAAALRRLGGAERRALVADIGGEARRMLQRAATAYYAARAEVSA